MTDIIDRLRFDAVRSELQFSKGVATNIEEAASEIARLRKGIQDYLDGNYGRGKHFTTKHDKCPHGLFQWESCENCIDAHFQAILTP